MNQRTTAAVRTTARIYNTIRGGNWSKTRNNGKVLNVQFRYRRQHVKDSRSLNIIKKCPADIVLAPSSCLLTDLEYADDVIIFTKSTTKLQHVLSLVSKLAAAYGLRVRPGKCKQMWISTRRQAGIRVDGQPIELVDKFCYLAVY
ncbi:hypothetical protein RB195_022878 [Necator americanus]